MPAYAPYLIPLVEDLTAEPESESITCPLDEEIWLTRQRRAPFRWEPIAARAKAVYGMVLIYRDEEIDVAQCELVEAGKERRCFSCSGRIEGFAMQHPAQLDAYDRLGKSSQQPLLIRPSLFARLISRLLSDGLIPEQQGPQNQDSTLLFRNELLELVRSSPSDWHLEPRGGGYEIRLRHHGRLGSAIPLSRQKGRWYVNSLRQACGIRGSAENKPLDGSFKLSDASGNDLSLRVSMIPSLHGLSVAVRFLYEQEESLDSLTSLGMDRDQQELILKQSYGHEGMVLVCGPTGSGKTTTLHALLRLSVRENIKVLSAEDPVERVLPGVQQVQVESGDGSGFATALRAFMRQAPDTILIGEIRDPVTAETALQAAFSGHRILSTLHARDTNGVYLRLADLGLPRATFEQALGIIIHQRLLPLLCGQCRIEISPPEALTSFVFKETGKPLRSLNTAVGCRACHDGYAGRTAIFNIDKPTWRNKPEYPLQRRAIDLLSMGNIDLETSASYLNLSLRNAFSFPSCKDFANYSLKHTPG